MIDCAHELK